MPAIFLMITSFVAKLRKKNSALLITKGLLFTFNKRAIVYVKSPKWTRYNRPFLDTRRSSLFAYNFNIYIAGSCQSGTFVTRSLTVRLPNGCCKSYPIFRVVCDKSNHVSLIYTKQVMSKTYCRFVVCDKTVVKIGL